MISMQDIWQYIIVHNYVHNTSEEAPKLLMWYARPVIRMGGE